VSYSQIGEAGAAALSEALKSNTTLTSLDAIRALCSVPAVLSRLAVA
jgi:hypothetical protein